ncbi:MAG TPA: methyl-accepting chemotaxis protein [Acetobacteraceae bacterium]|jgi:methyl-accepting chemotaxis protein|nr:methyl-accepting chemotaxis protein [Acetobacteraceae bacterium]
MMNLLNRLSIRNKTFVAFASMLLVIGTIGLLSIQKFSAMDSGVREITGNYLQAIGYVSDMRSAVLNYRLSLTKSVLQRVTGGDVDELQRTLTGWATKLAAVERKYAPTVVTGEEKAIYDDFSAAWQAYVSGAERTVDLLRAGKPQDAINNLTALAKIGERAGAALEQDAQFNADMGGKLAASVDGDFETGRWTVIGMLAVGLMIAIGVGYVMVRSIAYPLVQSAEMLGQLARRDYAFELSQASRGDEIGALSRAMDALRQALREADRLAAEAEAAQAARTRRHAAMDRHTQDFGASVSGVMASLASAAESMRSAAAAMARATLTAHEEAQATSTGAETSSQELAAVAAAVDEMSASVAEISRQVTTAAEIARKAVEHATTSQGTMHGLSEATTKIGDVVGLINDIAGQTNLLALNATIEAARAGDAGKGFAVVAGEVKALAAQTGKATAEIGDQIASVRASTDEAVAAMTEISSIISSLSEVSAAISAAVEQQSATTREIAQNVQRVSAATAGTARAMGNVVEAADSAGKVSRDVEASAGAIGTESKTLQQEVDQFLATIRGDTGERRTYERIPGNGAVVTLSAAGKTCQAAVKNVSRGGALLDCGWTLTPGTRVEVDMPGAAGRVSGRVSRCDSQQVAVVFSAEASALERIDRALDSIQAKPKAA